jgi:hypothetical protein
VGIGRAQVRRRHHHVRRRVDRPPRTGQVVGDTSERFVRLRMENVENCADREGVALALCRAHAARRGLQIIQTFEDEARSGASVLGRDGLMRLMDAARTRAFDVVVPPPPPGFVADRILSEGKCVEPWVSRESTSCKRP